MPERKEQGPQRLVREFSLGQEFYPFDPKYANQHVSEMGVNVYDSSILLKVKDALRIPLNIELILL